MKQKAVKKTQNKVVGRQGELVCAQLLKRKGFTILQMNYLQKWGEIDIIVQKDNRVHFVEVKTVSYGTKQDLEAAIRSRVWRPEENVHAYKLQKLARAVQSWLTEHTWSGDWQIDVAAVRIVPRETYARINMIENIVID